MRINMDPDRKRFRYSDVDTAILVTSLKMLQSDWLLKCKDLVIMTLRGAKTIFLDTWYATIEKM